MRVFDSHHLNSACDWLQDGKLLAYPTEAVWGLGCDPFNEVAVEQILAIKQRAMAKGMIVLTPNLEAISDFLAPLSKTHQQRIVESWENSHHHRQAATWLLPIPTNLTVKIPPWITGDHASLAIRLIEQPSINKLCQQLISPINPYGFLISTSCNPSGLPPAITISEAQAYFADSIGYLDDTTLGFTQPSQIRDAMTGEILR